MLLGNSNIVFDILKETYPNSYDAVAIKTWPIFIDFRESKFYKEFIALYSSDFETEEIEISENESIIDSYLSDD